MPPLPLCFAAIERRKRTFTPIYHGHGLRIASWNVDSIRTKLRNPRIFVTFIRSEVPDILFL